MMALGLKKTNEKLPAVFLGHGSPMNAIQTNGFTASLSTLGRTLPKPSAILAISAHWETDGTRVLAQASPPTIHDFYGFPEDLYRIQYPAPGALLQAEETAELLAKHEAKLTTDWGYDHGTWSVLRHLYPEANIPVYQLSLDRRRSLREHYDLGRELASLRTRGVLLVGSGNIVHNLRQIEFREDAKPRDWAIEFDQKIRDAIFSRDIKALTNLEAKWPGLARLALPSLEHYVPLLYIAGASHEDEDVSFPYEEIQNASISMRAVKYGA